MRRRKLPNQNIVVHLFRRQINCCHPISERFQERNFYSSVHPNVTVANVEKPSCFLRKFSPDGRRLVAFSSQQTAVEIYEFMGCSAAGDLLHRLSWADSSDEKVNSTPNVDLDGDDDWRLLRREIFHRFFRLRHTVRLTEGNEQLNRECSLFTADGRYLLVAASSAIHEEQQPRMSEMYQNNESLSPSSHLPPEDYCIYSVDMIHGHMVDKKRFKCDRIFLAHNQGLCLYDRTLAVLSVQHQTVHLFRMDNTGKLVPLQSIGRHLFDDDEMTMHSAMAPTYIGPWPRNTHVQPMADPMLNGIKQRLLTFLFRQAQRDDYKPDHDRRYAVRNFYRYFDFYRWLRIWRVQLMDENCLLIRYASLDMVSLRAEANTQISFFVFYDIPHARVLAVYESTSEELLHLYENFAEYFRGCSVDRRQSCLSNSVEARRKHSRFKNTILNAKFGGRTEAVRRVLSHLPISAQSFSSSPYLDQELFSYDEKWISSFERPKPYADYPIRFYGRRCGTFKFQIECGTLRPSSTSQNHRSLVAFIFHPNEPFAISVHKSNRDYVVNFHVRYLHEQRN